MYDVHSLIDEVASGLREKTSEIVPWFLEQIPAAYFQDTDHETRLSHLRAIIAARASGLPLRMTLRSADGQRWTFISERDVPGLLARLVTQLPSDQPLRAAKVHTARDGTLVLDTFEFGERERFDASDPDLAERRDLFLSYARSQGRETSEAALDAHLARCTADYARTVTPFRLFRNLGLFDAVSGTDDTIVTLEREESEDGTNRVVMTVGNATPRRLFERLAALLGQHRIDIRRAHLDVFDDDGNGYVVQLSFIVRGVEGAEILPKSSVWLDLRRDARRLKWVDELALGLITRNPGLGMPRAEVLRALAGLTHHVLCRVNAYAFALDRILLLVEKHIGVAREIADLFLRAFDPAAPLTAEALAEQAEALARAIERDVNGEDSRRILQTLLRAVRLTLRTNVYVEGRYGIALRVDPDLLADDRFPERPHGVFFVQGRAFEGFHVRFREIARGGVRVVKPIGAEQHAIEAERLYEEVYGLASAQQLKNKDIPEGGAKAVILIRPDASVARAVKGFADGLLDLITPEPETRARVVDRWGSPELLYLGPDENITNELIEWIVARAERRGYPLARAFMSSKPGAGINHKDYGVTSEGVTVFLEEALLAVGIDPRKMPFRVKLTGGPDGDVAGNEIKILFREYGEHARIVAIADGSGAAEDPDGLDRETLLGLVARSAPIAQFDRARLGPRGRMMSVDEPGGVAFRNQRAFSVLADAFVPAGGRPQTLHEGNWRAFLDEDGRPSARVIVEGANLFITPGAREQLGRAGALIVKDSSANKCGVICSSFEIAASMLLDEAEFMAHKERFVDEVLTRLRGLARDEARLLFGEYERRPGTLLPELSVRVSKLMDRARDAIEKVVAGLEGEDLELARRLVTDHLPAVLVERAGDRIFEQLPLPYLHRTMAARLAGRIVYREGLTYLEGLTSPELGEIALRFLLQEHETRGLLAELEASDLPSRARIATLIQRLGAH